MKALREAPIAVPWLGILRGDWPLVPLRYLVRFLSGGTPDKGNADFWSGGTIPWVSPKDMKVDRINDSEDHITQAALDRSATQFVPVGSVLVVVRGMILAHTLPVAVTTGPVTINQDIKALVCGQRILPEFLHAVLAGQAEWLLSQADSSAHGTKKLETEVLQRFEVPCPPLDLQRRIVATMRAQATSLDEVVAAKERVLDLLAEKRKAVISTAVTRGLDPKVKLRDSGVPWLGEIPAHWPLVPLRYLVSFLSGGTPDKGNADFWSGGTIPWVSPKDMKVEVIDDSEDHITEAAIDGSATRIVPVGSVLVVVRGMILAHTLPVAVTSGPVTINQDIKALGCSERLLPDFLRIVLAGQSRLLLSLADSSAHGTKKLETEVLQQLEVPVPALSEQQAIVEHIAHETAKLDAVRAATERTIALLKERRSALIAAAVTGQIDVGAAA